MSYNDLCIIGGGSIGGIIAYYAFRGGYTDLVVYYGSKKSVEEVNRLGGIRVLYSGREYFVPVKAFHYMSPYGKCRYVFNAVKTYNLMNTLNLTWRILSGDSLIILLQNGMGIHEEYAAKLGLDRVLYGVVFIGASRINPKTIVHHGGNTVYIGSPLRVETRLLELVNGMNRGGGDFRIVSDIELYRWIKLGVNTVINPLTAITRAPNKIVLSRYGRIIAEKILDEVVEAAKIKGVVLDKDKLFRIVMRSAENTAENYSSMAQDVMNNRRTEIDYLNGYIARIIGWDSVNGLLTYIVKLIEEYNTSGRISHGEG